MIVNNGQLIHITCLFISTICSNPCRKEVTICIFEYLRCCRRPGGSNMLSLHTLVLLNIY